MSADRESRFHTAHAARQSGSRRRIPLRRGGHACGITAAIVLFVALVLPSSLFAWASVTGFKTHQYIAESACELLKKEPVLQGTWFPDCSRIVAFEGSLGPDGPGNSYYSQHYYNPRLPEGRRGKGPTSAGEQYAAFAQELLTKKYPALAAKAGAYAEHYAADMNVPFHTNGVPKEYMGDYVNGNSVDEVVKGSNEFCYGCTTNPVLWLQTQLDYFLLSINNFNAASAADSKIDWFDPWFYNSAIHAATSSHALWEGVYITPLGSFLEGWDGWYIQNGNGPAVFDNPWDERRKSVEYMAVESAKWAADPKHLGNFHYGVNRSIRCVRTLWRAAISGIRPEVSLKETDEGQGIMLKITNAETGEDLRGVKARIKLPDSSGCELKRGKGTTDIVSSIPRGGVWQSETPVWVVASPLSSCSARVEVVGEFKEVPDLQYAVVETVVPKSASKVELKIKQTGEPRLGAQVSLEAETEPRIDTSGMTLTWVSSPAGAIASASGMGASFVAPAPGSYVVEATLLDKKGEKIARAKRSIEVGGGKVAVSISPNPAYFGKPIRITARLEEELPPGARDLSFKWREARGGSEIQPRSGNSADFTINAPEKPANADKLTYTLSAQAVASVNGVQKEIARGSGSVEFITPLFTTLHVTVKTDQNKPVSKATVALQSLRVSKQTDASGRADLDSLVPGEYTVSAGAPGFAAEHASVRLDPKNQEEAQKGTSVTITLRASASFFATAVDKENPSRLVPSVVFRLKGRQDKSLQGENGTAFFDNLAPGRYTIEATGPDNFVSDERDITLSPPDTGIGEQYVVYMYPAARVTAWIFGEKTKNMDGKPVKQPEPGWISQDGKPYVAAGTGTAVFERIPRGRHTFWGMATGYGTASSSVDVDPKVNGQYTVYIQLNPALTLRVEPRDPAGAIIRDAGGVLRSQDKVYQGKVTTGGSILFTDLPPGNYSLLVRANGFKDHVSPSITIANPREERSVQLEPAPSVIVSLSAVPQAFVGQNLQVVPRVSMSDGSQPPSNLALRWTDNGQVIEKNGPITVGYKQPGYYTVTLEVLQKDPRGPVYRVAAARHTVTVRAQEAPKGAIAIGGTNRILVGQTAGLSAAVSNTTADRSLYNVFWYLNGGYAGHGTSFSVPGSAPGTHAVRAVLVAAMNGSWYSVANAASTVTVTKPQEPPQQKPEPPRQIVTPQPQPKPEPPKQQAKQEPKPQPPVQTQQPQPPRAWGQLSKDEQQTVLNCLCRCNSTAAGHLTVVYDPKPSNSSPSCAQVSNGPCRNEGFGCWRHAPDGGSECAKGCYKRLNTAGVPDSVLKEGAATEKATADATKQFEACVKWDKERVDDATKELARVGQKDAPTWFRCGPIGTNWQMIPSNACCDPFRKDSDKNMEAASKALQQCGWKEEIAKRKANLDKMNSDCKTKYPGAVAR